MCLAQGNQFWHWKFSVGNLSPNAQSGMSKGRTHVEACITVISCLFIDLHRFAKGLSYPALARPPSSLIDRDTFLL